MHTAGTGQIGEADLLPVSADGLWLPRSAHDILHPRERAPAFLRDTCYSDRFDISKTVAIYMTWPSNARVRLGLHLGLLYLLAKPS